MGKDGSQNRGAEQQTAHDLADDTRLMESSKYVATTVSGGQKQYQGEEKMGDVSVGEAQSAPLLAGGGREGGHSSEKTKRSLSVRARCMHGTLPTVASDAVFSIALWRPGMFPRDQQPKPSLTRRTLTAWEGSRADREHRRSVRCP
jgi:hypothetical protein